MTGWFDTVLGSSADDDTSTTTSTSGDVSCSSVPKSCRIGEHEPDFERVHYGYFSKSKVFTQDVMVITETYWHECQTCGSTCDHHKRKVGEIKITDDGLKILSGGVES